MDLQTLNKEYVLWKTELKNKTIEIKNFETELKDLKFDLRTADGNLAAAEKSKDKKDIADKKKDKQNIEQKIEVLKSKLEKAKVDVEKIQANIDTKINTLKNDPELGQLMKQALANQYGSKMDQANKDKEKLATDKTNTNKRKDKFSRFEKFLKNKQGQSIKKDFIKLLEDKKKLKILQAEIAALATTDPAKTAKESEAYKLQQQILANPALNKINKNDLNITNDDIELLVNNLKTGSKGIDLSETFKQVKSSFDKSIKNIDKKIKTKEAYIEELKLANTKNEIETFKPVKEDVKVDEPKKEAEKLKWYQFVKRFKAWRENKKHPELPEHIEEKPEIKTPVFTSRDFVDAMKTDLGKDLYKDYRDDARKFRKEWHAEKDDHEI